MALLRVYIFSLERGLELIIFYKKFNDFRSFLLGFSEFMKKIDLD